MYVKVELEKCIEEIHSVFKVSADICVNKFKHDFTSIDEESINKALRFIDDIGDDLIEKYSKSISESKTATRIKKQWKLLLLDDELNKDYEIVKDLEKNGVEVICTTNGADAMKTLTEDDNLRGKMSVVLTDYRLYDNSGKVQVQQKIQGYTFLQNVGHRFQSKLLSAVVYSGMPRQFLLETFKTFKIRTEIYSKRDFKLEDAGARKYLVSRIIEMVRQTMKRCWLCHLAVMGGQTIYTIHISFAGVRLITKEGKRNL
ncbi:MAG: hypothetical protein IPP73_10235 [Chitinophagaceae bacterium]|nr:hypothetical protein [Chitinophagaceae bacterium]